jgi:GxxExxY protein
MNEYYYIDEKYPLSEVTGKIIKCAIEVHTLLGNGFQEVIYRRALANEFELRNIPFEREFEMPLYYKGEQIGTRRVDFLVDELVLVEIIVVSNLDEIHYVKVQNDLEAYNRRVGLILNFGGKSLDYKSVTNVKFQRQT